MCSTERIITNYPNSENLFFFAVRIIGILLLPVAVHEKANVTKNIFFKTVR